MVTKKENLWSYVTSEDCMSCTNPAQLKHQGAEGPGAPSPEGACYKCDQGHTSTHRQEQADKRVQGECTMSLDASGAHNTFQTKLYYMMYN